MYRNGFYRAGVLVIDWRVAGGGDGEEDIKKQTNHAKWGEK